MIKQLGMGLIIFSVACSAGPELQIGMSAPDFTLTDENDSLHTLSDYYGQKVVVYFYPKDDTPGCTKEACGIRDSYKVFEENNIVVLGISYDNAKSHREFKLKHGIPFSLLTDSEKSVSKLYGASGFFFPSRKTFLIDETGKLIKIYEKVEVTTHAEEILSTYLQKK